MIYLDNAATTWPKPQIVMDTTITAMKKYGANPGRSSHKMGIMAIERVYECREKISDFFNFDNPSNVVFTNNATMALNIVIGGILKKGDHVICTSLDHNSVLRPIFARQDSIEISVIESDTEGNLNLSDLKKSIKENTELMVFTHVSNVCGTISDVKQIIDICHKHKILVLLDISQSAGVLKIDLTELEADFVVTSGHKGLYGPMGTGILCINCERKLEPIIYGGSGSNSKELIPDYTIPDVFECGTLNLPGICGLMSGVEFVEQIGIDNIYNHEMQLTRHLIYELNNIRNAKIIGKKDIPGRTGVVSFVMDGIPSSYIADYLNNKHDIAVRSMFHCAALAHRSLNTDKYGTVRVSMGIYNTHDDIDLFIKAMKELSNTFV